MPKFTVHLTTVASTAIDIDAEDEDDAKELVYDQEFPSLCAQCSGWNECDPELELGDEWDIVEVTEQ